MNISRLHKHLFHTSAIRFKGLTPLTSVKHPEIKRNPIFSKLTRNDLDYFNSILGSQYVLYDPTDTLEQSPLTQYNTDWFNLYRGASSLCLFPNSTEEVSRILRYCNQRQLAIVPQGGNTGVSGGAVPVFDEVILNMSRLNKIRYFDAVSGVAVVDGGVILETLDQFLEPRGYTVPLDLGAKGSCHIGGNVSTNAGGLRLMRFGSLHGNVLGLEVVLPDGTVLDNLSTLRKDNTGYDLNQIFIGSEGTLGVVTGVSLLTPHRPKSTNVAMLGLSSFDDILNAFVMAKEDLSEILSAFEFWDHDSVGMVKKYTMPDADYPINGDHAFYVLLETQGSKQEHDQEKLDTYLNRLLDDGIANNGVIGQNVQRINSLWAWRERIPEAVTRAGVAMTYDVSMEVSMLYKMVEDAKEYFGKKNLLGPGKLYSNMLGFGHVGDGNLHILANLKGYDLKGQEDFDDFVFGWAIKNNGSITAEHGVGVSKVNYMKRAKSEVQLCLMKILKNAIDPKGIMNPYKVIPDH